MANITFLPLDLSGKARTNLREAESHTLIQVSNKPNRVCVLDHGAFYSKGLLVRDATGRALTQGTDYKSTYIYNELSNLTGKEIMALIVVTNTAVKSPIAVTYQAVGGPFSISVKELKAVLAEMTAGTENVKIYWEDIIGKPTEYIPAPHTHDWWEIFGMSSTVTEIDRITSAWKYSTAAIVNENNTFGDAYVQRARDAVAAFAANVRTHLANTANPHKLTKEQIGLDKVNNWAMADIPLSINRNADQNYFPIGGAYRILNTGPLPDLTTHVANRNNPHGTVAAHADCWTKTYVNSLFDGKYLLTDTAVNALTFNGRAQQTLRNESITALNSADLVGGTFPRMQMGRNSVILNNSGPHEYALCGDGEWRKWSDLFKPYNDSRHRMIALGSVSSTGAGSAITLLRTYYTTPAYPAGTYAFATIFQNPTPDVQFDNLYIYQRIGNDWQLLF